MKGKFSLTVSVLAGSSYSCALVTSGSHFSSRRSALSYKRFDHSDDHPEAATKLPLTESDLSRFTQLKEKHKTIPIVLWDSLLPRQQAFLSTKQYDSQALLEMKDYAVENSDSEIGILGFHPQTGDALSLGVTASIGDANAAIANEGESLVSVVGQRPFAVLGTPYRDETDSFYLADVEITQGRQDTSYLPAEETQQWHDAIPPLVQEWTSQALQSKHVDQDDLKNRLQDLGPLPRDPENRAWWVGMLLNPVNKYEQGDVCLEIRPAMLSCRNDVDRLLLAGTALQSSIQHLSGDQRLF